MTRDVSGFKARGQLPLTQLRSSAGVFLYEFEGINIKDSHIVDTLQAISRM